jgi:hypothetical protein
MPIRQQAQLRPYGQAADTGHMIALSLRSGRSTFDTGGSIYWPVAVRSMEGLNRRFASAALLMERPQRDGCTLELPRQPA